MVVLWLLASLGGKAQTDWSSQFPPGRVGADSLLRFALQADDATRQALTHSLFPTPADCKRLLRDERLARRVYRYQRYLRRRSDLVLGPMLARQTELLLWQATSDELEVYEGEAQFFPGGYHELADQLAHDLVLYRAKFVEPGRRLGSAFDVLVYLNGHWRLIHRPWVILFD